MENYLLDSMSDGKGGVYITKLSPNGDIWIWYCKDGSITEIK